ncbi:MAG: hypothetical protein ACJ0QX_01555 [Gammaproteobacteria bacterium]|tara:strand:- start:26303 stop:28336 length:2034 start_codon:yes stop_codon:yes gene_type:complete
MKFFNANIIKYIILSFPIISLIMWSFNNSQITNYDGAAYIDYAVYVSSAWEQGNFIEFVERFFGYRGWRVNNFHYFYLLPLIITGQNLFASAFIVNLFFLSLSLFFIYKIFRLYLSKIDSSFCASIICCTHLIIFGGYSHPLYSEIAFVPFTIATFYYLFKSRVFSDKKNSYMFALFLFLVISLRPMQGIINLIIPLVIYSVIHVRNKSLSINEISKSLLIFFSCLSLLFIIEIAPYEFSVQNNEVLKSIGSVSAMKIFEITALITILATLSIYIFYIFNTAKIKISVKKFYLYESFVLLSILFVLFYFQHFSELYRWIYIASFGSHVENYKNITPIFDTLRELIMKGSLFLFTLIFILFIFTFIKINFQKIKNRIDDKNIYILLYAFPIPILIYIFTAQNNYRVVTLSMILLLIFSLIYICINNKNSNLKNTFLFFMLSVIFSGNYIKFNITQENRSFYYKDNDINFVKYIVGSTPSPINVFPNPNETLILEISKISKKYNIKSFAIQESGMEAIDPSYASLLSKVEKYNYFHLNTLVAPNSSEDMNFEYIKNYDALVIVNPISLHKISHGTLEVDKIVKDFEIDSNSLGALEKNSTNIGFFEDFINKRNIDQQWINKLNNSSLHAIYLAYSYMNQDLHRANWRVIKCFDLFNEDTAFQEKACIFLNTNKHIKITK